MERECPASCTAPRAARVLVIGNYAPLTRALRRGLEEEGFTVDVATSFPGEGDPFAERYDAVILDINGSGASALSAVEQWRRCGLRAPLLALSSPDGPGDVAPEVDDWLPKPFALNDLLTRLHALARAVPEPSPLHSTS
jgi:DNA-binding response OmpR family regulator